MRIDQLLKLSSPLAKKKVTHIGQNAASVSYKKVSENWQKPLANRREILQHRPGQGEKGAPRPAWEGPGPQQEALAVCSPRRIYPARLREERD